MREPPVDGDSAAPIVATRYLTHTDRQLLGLWLMVRLLTFIWAAQVSVLRPLTERERLIPLWPPSAPLGGWIERALLAPWERRDTIYFIRIVARGYRSDDGTATFHPLLAWLASPLAWLTGSPLVALLLVSSIAGLLLLLAFERLARADLPPDDARTSTMLLLFSPLAFVLFAPYTEGLWLLCAALCVLYARRRRWWHAGLAGALATLTRQQGLFLMLPLALELWQAVDGSWRRALTAWRDWLTLLLIPAGMLVWLAYRAMVLQDVHPDISSAQTLIYSLLISPSAHSVVPVQAFMWPWQALGLALEKLQRAPEYSLVIDLVLAGAFLVMLALAWRHMRASYRLYAAAIVLVSFSLHTGPFYPYMGLPRHLLLAFPVFIGLGPVVRGRWSRLCVVGAGLFGMMFLLLQYVFEGWVP